MPDAYHYFGADLQLDSSNGLMLASGPLQTQQRLYRRLMTNPGDLPGHPEYGGGLAAFVGQPVNSGQISAVILKQCRLEADVAQVPTPTVVVAFTPAGGFASATVNYTDASGATQTLAAPLV